MARLPVLGLKNGSIEILTTKSQRQNMGQLGTGNR